MRVLIVEDEEKVSSFIKKGLESEGFVVECVADGIAGLDKATESSFDVIILDLMLPGLDGLSVLRQIRQRDINTHVIILTARASVKDRIEGLNNGADDYLAKPFSFGELLARIRALLRRNSDNKKPVLSFDGLEIDPQKREVRRNCRGPK
ncbi:response regulator transcription factor [bacterium]|nr:response regulator transcription factor [bacterium]